MTISHCVGKPCSSAHTALRKTNSHSMFVTREENLIRGNTLDDNGQLSSQKFPSSSTSDLENVHPDHPLWGPKQESQNRDDTASTPSSEKVTFSPLGLLPTLNTDSTPEEEPKKLRSKK